MNGLGKVEECFALLNFQGETEVSLVKMCDDRMLCKSPAVLCCGDPKLDFVLLVLQDIYYFYRNRCALDNYNVMSWI